MMNQGKTKTDTAIRHPGSGRSIPRHANVHLRTHTRGLKGFSAARTAALSPSRPGALFIFLLLAATFAHAQVPTNAIVTRILAAEPHPGIRLVDVSSEYTASLGTIAEHLENDELEEAMHAIHMQIMTDSPQLHPHWSNVRRHVSSIHACVSLLGQFPEALLADYRFSHRTAATQRFQNAQSEGDPDKLLHESIRYFHTEAGTAALNLFAQLAFDRGHFMAAARAWEKLYLEATTTIDRPFTAAKAAVAYHLGGDQKRARDMHMLLNQHEGATALVAGEMMSLHTMVTEALASSAPPRTRPEVLRDWPQTYGSADAAAVMKPCDVSGLELWSLPQAEKRANLDACLHRSNDTTPEYGTFNLRIVPEAGKQRLILQTGGQPSKGFIYPALIHPVIAGGKAFIRKEDELYALDYKTGKTCWRLTDFPLYDKSTSGQTRNHFRAIAGDMGRYTATCANGLVFAVGNFEQLDPDSYTKFGSSDSAKADNPAVETESTEDTSTLAAISAEDGTVVWTARDAKYLSAPTIAGGQLFVLAKVGNRYRLLCVDAGTGAHIWQANIGPIPTDTGDERTWQEAYTMEVLTERGSPVSVKNGTVYLTTNSGLIAAFRQATGEPLWTYRYDSSTSGHAGSSEESKVSNLAFMLAVRAKPVLPQNPLLITGGRVICLPTDSRSVIALDALTGELLWKQSRHAAQHLTAVDGDRILLSNPGLTVLSTPDGNVVKRIEVDVTDKPAVTAREIIASGAGALLTVNLENYSMVKQPVADSALLGNLVVFDGTTLVSANAAGTSVFPGFHDAWEALETTLAEEKDPAEIARCRIMRGRLAAKSDLLVIAAKELQKALQKAQATEHTDLTQQAEEELFEVLLLQVRATDKDSEAEALLEAAERHAATETQKVRILAEQLAFHKRFDRPAEAEEAARHIAESYPAAWLELPDQLKISEGTLTGYAYGLSAIDRIKGKDGTGTSTAPILEDDTDDVYLPLYRFPDNRAALMRGYDNSPITAGTLFFAHNNSTVFCLDSRGLSFEQAVQWQVPLVQKVIENGSFGYADADRNIAAFAGIKELVLVKLDTGKEILRKPWTEYDVEPWVVTVGEGPLAVLGGKNRIYSCINLLTGAREWQISQNYVWQRVRTANGLLYGSTHWVNCLAVRDLTSGHLIWKTGTPDERTGRSVALMNDDGFVAGISGAGGSGIANAGGTLSFHNPLGPALHRTTGHKLDAGAIHEVAAFGNRFAVIWDMEDHGNMQLHDVAGEHEIKTISIRNKAGDIIAPAWITPDKDRLLFACGNTFGHDGALTKPFLVCMDPEDTDELWRFELPDDDETKYVVSTPQIAGDVISFVLRKGDPKGPARHYLLDRETGEEVFVYPAHAAGMIPLDSLVDSMLRLDNRLFIETDRGILCCREAGEQSQ